MWTHISRYSDVRRYVDCFAHRSHFGHDHIVRLGFLTPQSYSWSALDWHASKENISTLHLVHGIQFESSFEQILQRHPNLACNDALNNFSTAITLPKPISSLATIINFPLAFCLICNTFAMREYFGTGSKLNFNRSSDPWSPFCFNCMFMLCKQCCENKIRGLQPN